MMNSYRFSFFSGFLSFLLLLSGCSNGGSSASTYESTISGMTAHIEQHMTQNQVTGLSIALVDGENVVWVRGFGYADREANIPAAADTIYEIGSLSKTFAAAAVMRLSEEGRMNIDQPLTHYVPEFSIHQRFPASGPITIHSILTHHSGIPGDLFNGAFTESQSLDYDTWLIDYLKNEYTSAPVGSVLAYSNSAVALLRRAIGAVAPGGFTAYANDLFDRIGMPATSYELDERIPRDKLSQAYSEGVRLPQMYGNLSTAGSVRSSVSDMAKYIRMIHAGGITPNGRILSQASLDAMFTRQNRNTLLDFDQGIGFTWFLGRDDYYGGRRIEHEGASPWFHAMIRILLDHQLGVIVLSNTMDADVAGIAQETLELALLEKKGLTPPSTPVPCFSPPDTTWTQEQFQKLAGTYVAGTEGMNFGTIAVEAATGGLLIADRPGLWIPRQNGYFSLAGDGSDAQRVQFRFHAIDGRDIISVLYGGEKALYAERYEQGAIPAVWTARQGSYIATNINPGSALWPGTNTMAVEVGKDGFLRLKGTLRGDIPIKPLTDTLAITGGIGRNRGESVRVVTVDGKEQIELWGFRYKRTL